MKLKNIFKKVQREVVNNKPMPVIPVYTLVVTDKDGVVDVSNHADRKAMYEHLNTKKGVFCYTVYVTNPKKLEQWLREKTTQYNMPFGDEITKKLEEEVANGEK